MIGQLRNISVTYLYAFESEVLEIVPVAVVMVRDQNTSYRKCKYSLVVGRELEK